MVTQASSSSEPPFSPAKIARVRSKIAREKRSSPSSHRLFGHLFGRCIFSGSSFKLECKKIFLKKFIIHAHDFDRLNVCVQPIHRCMKKMKKTGYTACTPLRGTPKFRCDVSLATVPSGRKRKLRAAMFQLCAHGLIQVIHHFLLAIECIAHDDDALNRARFLEM